MNPQDRAAPRPEQHFDPGLQHERTALAWERTAISAMVAGVLLTRYTAADAPRIFALVGVVETMVGGGLLVWAGRHYEDLHGPLRRNESVVHPTAARLVGLATIAFAGAAFILALAIVATG